ncbi:MAG: hypothetical protein Q8O67_27425 [Deltaproteobacteria bacterium]|nr:hypothetical protein [Deltaproteobacteria bacterium]
MPFTHDESRYPILVTVWVGESELADVHAYHAWLDVQAKRARAAGLRLALISDASKVTRTRPDVRREFASLRAPIDGIIAGTWVVTTSMAMRGVMAAVGWLNPKMAGIRVSPTMTAAVQEATAVLQQPTGH